MYKKLPLSLLFLFVIQFAFSQDGLPVYSDYLVDNLYLLHPSMAGAAAHNQIRFTARQQWFGQDEAPNLQTLNFNARLGKQSGVGLILFNDKNGYHSQRGGYVTYAHHLMFSRSPLALNQLSFGINVGLLQSSLDETEFDLNDFDPIILGDVRSTSYFNIDTGISYNLYDFSAHFTVKNLLLQNRDLYSEDYESNNQRRYILSAGYTIGNISSPWSYEPSFMAQLLEFTDEKSLDINFKAFRKMEFGTLWGGLSYRRNFDGAEYLNGTEVKNQKLQYITPFVGGNYKGFMIAYTYSYLRGDINFGNGGFHQITLGYEFLGGREKPYDCNCPSIN